MKRVFYCMNSAMDAGIKQHPQLQMKELGIKYHHSRPQSVFDGWEFWVDDDVKLPNYIEEVPYEPFDKGD